MKKRMKKRMNKKRKKGGGQKEPRRGTEVPLLRNTTHKGAWARSTQSINSNAQFPPPKAPAVLFTPIACEGRISVILTFANKFVLEKAILSATTTTTTTTTTNGACVWFRIQARRKLPSAWQQVLAPLASLDARSREIKEERRREEV